MVHFKYLKGSYIKESQYLFSLSPERIMGFKLQEGRFQISIMKNFQRARAGSYYKQLSKDVVGHLSLVVVEEEAGQPSVREALIWSVGLDI